MALAIANNTGSQPSSSFGGGSLSTNAGHTVKRKVDILEMLSFVHSLGIDHVRESEMLWIAEEAYNAPLPPGWTEHVAGDGKTYFYNTTLRQSLWQHPLDEVFMEIANYWRRVMREGGFWEVDDELAELEEKIRADLSDWMELYDSSGNKFYFNRVTEESCFDDPRHTTYHTLYTRIRLVNMMKDKLPLLALAPRPSEVIVDNAAMQRQKQDAERHVELAILRVQTAFRMMRARTKAKQLLAQRSLDRVPNGLKDKILLNVRSSVPGTHRKEVVLGTTKGYKRTRAAIKIQARIRAHHASKRFRPILEHQRYMAKHAVKIQRQARIWLARRKRRNDAHQKRVQACVRIQSWARMLAARQLFAEKKGSRDEFDHMGRVILMIQTNLRGWMARIRVAKMRVAKYTPPTDVLQRAVSMYLAKAHMVTLIQQAEPVQCFFTVTKGQAAALLRYTWRLGMLPIGEDGKIEDAEKINARNADRKKKRKKTILRVQAGTEEPMEPLPYSIDLFRNVGVASLEHEAASMIQRVMKGIIRFKKFQRIVAAAKEFCRFVVDAAADDMVRRRAAAPIIQKMFRGWSIRRQDLIKKKYQAWLDLRLQQRLTVQAHISRFHTMDWLFEFCHTCKLRDSATIVQARWRGIMARRHVALLAEEAEWCVKGWFEYTGMGRDCVRTVVKFLPNPRFNPYRHFKRHGKPQTLLERIQDMQAEIDAALLAHLTPEEFAAREAEKEAEAAAKQAEIDSANEAREQGAMTIEENLTWIIEETTRAAEREARRLVELELMSKEEELMREYLEQALHTQTVANALASHSGYFEALEEEDQKDIQHVAGALATFSRITWNEEEEELSEVVANALAKFAGIDENAEDETYAGEDAAGTADEVADDVLAPEAAPQAEMDMTSLQDAASHEYTSAAVQDPSSLLGGESLPEQNSSLDSRAAYRVLTEAAADLKAPSEGSHRSSGRRRGDSSQRSRGSRDATAFAPKPLPLQPDAPEQPFMVDQGYPQRGKPRFEIRPGLVDMAALRKLERTQVAHRERRGRIADKRRDMYPIQSQVELSPLPQRMIHRHVHHHVHHHGTEENMTPYQMFDGGSTALPPPARLVSGGRETLEPIKIPSKTSSKTSSKKSAPIGKSKSDSQIRLKPLQPAGAAGSALRKKSFADSLDSGSSGYLPQRNLQAARSLDSMETPRRGAVAS
eukprot:TRINITY_DN31286_c0_g1_i1.p1 TRINITY_DN31286_c0_g1~~TRINITY_DN31286_c0_g1_i1.p1  ORF type:complete len:1189 (+),score=217.37 TRINITY_DN31286_c0_g1_i1:127-3693(+)